jgi:mono/diheme cytochrome c family protein
MTWMAAGAFLFVFGLGLAGLSTRPPADDESRTFADARCPRCHGEDAQGATAPALVPMTYSIERFTRIVRAGNDVMPAFTEEELGDADVAAIHRYLKSLGDR